MLTPDIDNSLLASSGLGRIIGIDEAGRGAWAGPVAVGYFTLTPQHNPVKGINDSKLVRPAARESLFSMLQDSNLGSVPSGVLLGEVEQINTQGIGLTITSLILQIIGSYNDGNTLFIIDGQFKQDFGPNTIKRNKADSTYYSVAAASILAKVSRDRIMQQLDLTYPGYSFAKHVGYGTALHRQLIQAKGICEIHRTSFKPLGQKLS